MPTALELAVDWCFGLAPEEPALVARPDPVAAMEDALRPALRRPPCVISFSGGRDSSILLAVATRLARREGLPPPIPSSQQFPDDAGADERDWQELVVGHLGLGDWHRIAVRDEFDLVGPAARQMWAAHGFVWPPGIHTALPAIGEARGGSFVTGDPGDDIFVSWPWGLAATLLYGRRDLGLRAVRQAVHALAPPRARRRWAERTAGWKPDWLRAEAARVANRRIVEVSSAAPVRYDRWIAWLGRLKGHRTGFQNLTALAAAGDVMASFPFWDPGFRAAMGAWAGPTGPGDRTAAVAALFGDLLPGETVRRTTKAHSSDVLWGPATRQFAEEWSGRGLWEDLVEPELLRSVWRERGADGPHFSLLQLAYLSDRSGHSAQEIIDDAVKAIDVVPGPGEPPGR